jgi:thioesterase domain-containing protein
MTVSPLLAELRARDIRVWDDGNQLRCNAPAGALTPELRHQVQECKNDILEFLHSAEALARQQRAIVPLQPRGGRAPVFAVAGHNGDVFCYRALAKCLGDDQPFYGLHPPGLDGQNEPLARVENLAAYFAGQIRAFQPDGPCIIAGYCAGGTIAFELARQLLQRGAAVSFLTLFGSPYSTWFRRLPQLRRHAGALASRSWRQRLQYIAVRLQAKRDAARAAKVDPVLTRRAKVEKTTIAAVCHYTPVFFAGRVAIFLPNREWVRCGPAPLRWRLMAQHAEEYFGPDACDADSMLREPFAPAFAELFRQCREK